MTTPPAAMRHIIVRRREQIDRVAYSLDDIQRFWGKSVDQIAHYIRRGLLPARHNGGRYLVAGGAILDRTLRPGSGAVPYHGLLVAVGNQPVSINDHRQVIHADDEPYTYDDLAKMFGWSAQAVRRLNYNGHLQPDIVNATRPLYSPVRVLAYLDGRDEPIAYHASA